MLARWPQSTNLASALSLGEPLSQALALLINLSELLSLYALGYLDVVQELFKIFILAVLALIVGPVFVYLNLLAL